MPYTGFFMAVDRWLDCRKRCQSGTSGTAASLGSGYSTTPGGSARAAVSQYTKGTSRHVRRR